MGLMEKFKFEYGVNKHLVSKYKFGSLPKSVADSYFTAGFVRCVHRADVKRCPFLEVCYI